MNEELLNNSGLINIYLNNSIFSGVLTQISCKGHTVNFGNNGAGKTSIINLVPIFYGLTPNTLFYQRGNKSSFVDFYLPYSTSMIVFEYLKKGQKKNSIVFRHNDSYRYCFVDGDAEKILFSSESLDNLRKLNSTEQWIKQYVRFNEQCTVSKLIDSSSLYQAILMNNRDVIYKNKDNRVYGLEASRFSLCESNEDVRHLASLTAVMLSDNTHLLDELRQMLTDCYVSDQVNLELPKTNNSLSHIDELEAVAKLSNNMDKYYQAVEIKKQIADNWGVIKECEKRLHALKTDYTQNISNLDTQITSKKEALEQIEEKYSKSLEELNQKKSEKVSSQKNYSELIKKVIEKKEDFEEKDLETKSEQYHQLPFYTQERDRLLNNYKKLEQDYKDKINPLELLKTQRKNELYEEKSQLVNELNLKLVNVNNKISSTENDCETKLAKISISFKEKLDSSESQYKGQKDNYINQLSTLQDQRLSESRFSSEENINLETSQNDIDRYDTLLKNNLKVQSEKHTEIEKIKYDIQKLENDCSSIWNNKNQIISQLEDLKKQLNPPESSLIGFMEKNTPEWRDNVGKVIRKELLFKDGLHPYIEEQSNSLFGICLDLDNITIPEYIKPRQELEDKIQQLNIDLDELQPVLNKQENLIKQKRQTLTETDNELSDLKREVISLEAALNLAKEGKANLEQEYKENCRKRVELFNKKILDVKEALNALELNYVNYKEQLATLKNKREFDCKADYEEKLRPLRSEQDNIRQRLNSIDDEYKEKLEDIEHNYNAELIRSGVNDKKLLSAREDFNKAQNLCNNIQSYQKAVVEYDNFIIGEYSQLEEHRDLLNKVSVEIREYEHQIEEEEQRLKDETSPIKNEIKSLSDSRKQLKHHCETIGKFLDDNSVDLKEYSPEIEEKEYLPDNLSADSLMSSCKDKLGDVKTKLSSLTKKVRDFSSIMEDQTGKNNVIAGIWNQIYESVNKKYDDNETGTKDNRYFFALTDRLEEFLSKDFNDIRNTIFTSFAATAIKFTNFYENLQHFNRVVRSVSNNFEKKLSSENPLETITDIKIALVSKIERLEIYPRLKRLSDFYYEWELSNKTPENLSQPSDDLVKSFRQVMDAFVNNEIKTDVKSLIELDISMNINGRHIVVRQDKDLSTAGSTGETKLAINVIFCGLTRMLCPNKDIKVHWPLDEIGEIYNDNLQRLFSMTENYGIYLFCAQPNISPDKVQLFESKNFVSKSEGVSRCVEGYEEQPDNPLIEMLADGV